jgi:hypothetical protein
MGIQPGAVRTDVRVMAGVNITDVEGDDDEETCGVGTGGGGGGEGDARIGTESGGAVALGTAGCILPNKQQSIALHCGGGMEG